MDAVSKRFGDVVALDSVSLDIRRGIVFGLFGPNGAGKSTLVRMLVGLAVPDDGSISVGGIDVVADPAAGRRLCSFQPQLSTPIGLLSPVVAIRLAGQLRGLSRRDASRRAQELIDEFDLGEWATRPAQELSGGVARLVNFAMTIAAPAPIVVLDEPTNDVDPARRRTLWNRLRQLADAGATVILVTHNVVEAEQVVDDLAVLDRGRVVASGRPDALRAGDELRLRATVLHADFGASSSLEWTRTGSRAEAVVPVPLAVDAIEWATSAQASGLIADFALTPSTLEDSYLGSLALDSPEDP